MKRPAFSFSPRQSSTGRMRLAAAHDLRRVDRVERVRVVARDHRDLVVHLIDQAAHVAAGKKSSCASLGELVEVAREVDRARRRRAGSRRSRARPRARRPSAARRTAAWRSRARRRARRRPGLIARAAAEGEVDEDGGVALEDLLRGRVGHGGDPNGRRAQGAGEAARAGARHAARAIPPCRPKRTTRRRPRGSTLRPIRRAWLSRAAARAPSLRA